MLCGDFGGESPVPRSRDGRGLSSHRCGIPRPMGEARFSSLPPCLGGERQGLLLRSLQQMPLGPWGPKKTAVPSHSLLTPPACLESPALPGHMWPALISHTVTRRPETSLSTHLPPFPVFLLCPSASHWTAVTTTSPACQLLFLPTYPQQQR